MHSQYLLLQQLIRTFTEYKPNRMQGKGWNHINRRVDFLASLRVGPALHQTATSRLDRVVLNNTGDAESD